MSKKMTFGKLAGIIFCIIAAAAAVVLMFASGYYGGQMKLIDKYYTALERDDFNSYQACFGHDRSEKDFADDKAAISILQDNDKIHAKADFVRREKYNQYIHIVYYDMTVYNDDESAEKSDWWLSMRHENGKWIIV